MIGGGVRASLGEIVGSLAGESSGVAKLGTTGWEVGILVVEGRRIIGLFSSL